MASMVHSSVHHQALQRGLWVGQTCGPSLPGTSIVMLLPLSRIWSSLVMRRPS